MVIPFGVPSLIKHYMIMDKEKCRNCFYYDWHSFVNGWCNWKGIIVRGNATACPDGYKYRKIHET